ncbi:MAG: dihydrolipoyl dehydrogenase [Bacteroidetes bacterium]|nr:dihydrolipoyl dehydrogenase [Bacteroidota bacterium]
MEYDVIIIGSGPAGYVAAIRAGQLGLKTILIEKKQIGGMCLNWGCIPTKSLIESAKFYRRLNQSSKFGIDGIDMKKVSFNWENAKKRANLIVKKLGGGISHLLKKNGVEILIGEACITSQNTVTVNNRNIEGKNMIIATGSYPKPVHKNVPKKILVELDKLFDLDQIPTHVVLTGHGPTVAEMAQFFRFIGKEVTVLLDHQFIIHDADPYLSDYLEKKLIEDQIKIIHTEQVDSYSNGHLIVGEQKVKCDIVINCNYRNGITPPSDIKIDTDDNGFIPTDDNLMTAIEGIYAIGDVNGKSYLAHAASAQGIWVINHLKGIKNSLNLKLYPLNIYTTPEIAQIGMSEAEIKNEGYAYKINEFPLSANGKALTEGLQEGLVRLISETKYGQVLGVQIIAENATDMIAEASAYMQIEGTVYDIAQTIHAHPTVSEIFMEAGFDAVDKAIHK